MIRINIAFRLPKEVEQEAIGIATKLGTSKDSLTFLDGVTSLPHVSIYAPVVDEENINNILHDVKQITSQMSSLYFTLKEITESQGFMTLEFGLTPDIKKIQEKSVEKLLPIVEKNVTEPFEKGNDYHMVISPGSEQSLEKYGSVGIINYHPHLTLLRVKDPIDATLVKRKVTWSIPRFLVSKIGVFVMGGHGVCKELIEEFPLLPMSSRI